MAEMIDADKIRYFLTCLYGAVEDDSRLVLSYANLDKKLRSEWIKPDDTQAATEFFRSHQDNPATYFGVALRDGRAERGEYSRGGTGDVVDIPGLWCDVDIAGGAHAQQGLPPTKEAAVQLVYDAMKCQSPKRAIQPSLIVNTGGGVHAYWLFEQPFVISNGADRQFIRDLNDRLNRQIQATARERGWSIDNVSDLARVLRVPGTLSKYGSLTCIEQDTGYRWPLDAFDWLPKLPKPATGHGIDYQGLDIVRVAEAYSAELSQKSQSELQRRPSHARLDDRN